MSTYIYWQVSPAVIAQGYTYWDKANIYRSPVENDINQYSLVISIASVIGSTWTVNYSDATAGNGTDKYYIVKYYNTAGSIEDVNIQVTHFPLSPREARIVQITQHMMDPRLTVGMQDYDYLQAINMSLQMFNSYPPPTCFTWDNLPYGYEAIIAMGAMISAILQRYLGVSMRDFSYSDNGLTLNLDLQGKMRGAVEEVWRLYEPMIKLFKLEEAPQGMGIGSWAIPLGVGRVSSALMNVLDLYRSYSY